MLAVCSFGQTTQAQRWEKARYEQNVNNQKIYYFEVFAVNHEFSGLNFEMLKNDFYEKEGIIDVKSKDEKRIVVYVYDMIDIDVIKTIFSPFDSEIEISQKIVLNTRELDYNSVN